MLRPVVWSARCWLRRPVRAMLSESKSDMDQASRRSVRVERHAAAGIVGAGAARVERADQGEQAPDPQDRLLEKAVTHAHQLAQAAHDRSQLLRGLLERPALGSERRAELRHGDLL